MKDIRMKERTERVETDGAISQEEEEEEEPEPIEIDMDVD